jgi:hypothetical protein
MFKPIDGSFGFLAEFVMLQLRDLGTKSGNGGPPATDLSKLLLED